MKKIFVDDEISITRNQTRIDPPAQLFGTPDPVWVYIYSQSYSAETTKTFNSYTIGVLSSLIASKLGLKITASALVAIVTIAITDYANKNVMDMERDTYGNQNNLNHYMYEDSYYIAGDFIDTKVSYNPTIY